MHAHVKCSMKVRRSAAAETTVNPFTTNGVLVKLVETKSACALARGRRESQRL